MKQDRIYSIKTGMHQFYNQFGIERVMVEGGVGILSSFLNDCVDDTGDSEDGDGSSNRRRYNQVADCI